MPAHDRLLEAFTALARAEFGEGAGIVRLAACRDAGGRTVLVGTPRPLGEEPAAWRAVRGPEPHPGPRPPLGAKLTERAYFDGAKAFADARAADEAVLLDAAGRLVEGARSNLLVVTAAGRLVRPRPQLGAVAGLALELVVERVPDLEDAEVDDTMLAEARELIAVNAVRGAAPVVTLDGRPVGDGRPGPRALALREQLA